ncbi:MAG TPA: lipopolysaccharide biosynthesis protein [Terriglobales bacterium]|nr:lipopolysaccharide biosynthesis protein [Terriglobales bacterium]
MPTVEKTTDACDSQAQTRNLDQHLVRGLAWTGAVKWGGQLATWAATIVVARLLTPADYGLIGMANLYLGLVALISEFGIGTAIVSIDDLGETHLRQLNTVSFLVGLIGVLASAAAALPLARFFHTPKLSLVLIVMSSAFLISSLQTVANAALQRQLRFKLLAGLEGSKALVTSGASIALAYFGAGYWTLVFGGILGTLVATVLTFYARPVSFSIPKLSDIKHALKFSNDILITRFSWYTFDNADFLIAGRVLGQAALGTYTLAWSVAGLPVEKIASLFGRVSPAFFSAVQKDNAALRRYLLGLTEPLATAAFPVSIGIAVIASDLIALAFGPKWSGAVWPLRLLMIAMTFRGLALLMPFVLNVKEQTRFMMWSTVACAVILPAGFYFGSFWGISGIAAMWTILYPILRVPMFQRTFKVIDLQVKDYLRTIWPALSSSILMGAAVWGTSVLVKDAQSIVLRLTVQVSVGVMSYLLCMFGLHRAATVRMMGVIRNFRNRG